MDSVGDQKYLNPGVGIRLSAEPYPDTGFYGKITKKQLFNTGIIFALLNPDSPVLRIRIR
jgi:hypothetical protein